MRMKASGRSIAFRGPPSSKHWVWTCRSRGSSACNSRRFAFGLIFDGNIQSLPGYFVYDAAVNRAVSVDARGMIKALKMVYQADAIVAELTAGAK